MRLLLISWFFHQTSSAAVSSAVGTNDPKEEDNNNTNVAYWISLACCNGSTLNDGNSINKALDMIQRKDPYAKYIHGIGINCCDSLHIGKLVQTIAQHMANNNGNNAQQQCRRGIIIYPNSGEEWDATTETWKSGTGIRKGSDDDDDDGSTLFTNRIQNAIQIIYDTSKASLSSSSSLSPPPKIIIGGCCRTTPSEIQALRKWIDKKTKLLI